MTDHPFFNQRLEYYRLVLQLTHERNQKLVGFIRLTDGAIWGFLGVASFNLFKIETSSHLENLILFSGLLIISVYLWRLTVKTYQIDIVKGYCRIARCEDKLGVPYQNSIAKNFADIIKKHPSNYDDLFDLLTPQTFKDPNHKKLNCAAFVFGYIGIIGFFCGLPIDLYCKLLSMIALLPVWALVWIYTIFNNNSKWQCKSRKTQNNLS